MAAPMAERENYLETEINSLTMAENNSESVSKDGEGTDYILQFVEKEIGCDLKALGKVSGMLEKLKAENKALEEQVTLVIQIGTLQLFWQIRLCFMIAVCLL